MDRNHCFVQKESERVLYKISQNGIFFHLSAQVSIHQVITECMICIVLGFRLKTKLGFARKTIATHATFGTTTYLTIMIYPQLQYSQQQMENKINLASMK